MTLAVLAIAVIGGFVLFTALSGGGTKSQWYQEGYDVGSRAASLAKLGSSPDAACDLALIDKIEFDDSRRGTRAKDLKRGCLQAVHDLLDD